MFFGDKSSGAFLRQFSKVSIQRHVIVRGTSSPDDPALKAYWQRRQSKQVSQLLPQQLNRQALSGSPLGRGGAQRRGGLARSSVSGCILFVRRSNKR